MDYTTEQLKQIKQNLNLISVNAVQILKSMDQEGELNQSDIHKKAGISKFVTDKCIAGFLATGLVKRMDDGVKRFFKLTKEGKKILEIEEEN